MVWRFQFSCLQLSGRGGHPGGLGAALELKCAGVCVCQLALVSALLGLVGSAGNFSTLFFPKNSCVLLFSGYHQFQTQSCLNIFF